MEGPHARLRLRVVPGARRAAVAGRHGEAWKLRVAAPAERGKANEAVIRLLADELGVSARDVVVVSGRLTRDKVVEVRGVTTEDAERRLAARKEKV